MDDQNLQSDLNGFAGKAEELSKRLVSGRAVFFIGAGFSLDSEGNTAARFIGRLLARAVALAHYLSQEQHAGVPPEDRATLKQIGEGLLLGLKQTFHLEGETHKPAELLTPENIESLARNYYVFNDWVAHAYADLLRGLDKLANSEDDIKGEEGKREAADGDEVDRDHIKRIGAIEQRFLRRTSQDTVPLEPIGLRKLNGLRSTEQGDGEGGEPRAKALFLDTMGFRDGRVFAGEPWAESAQRVADSYGSRLRPRHHVLARLAREGLCPVLLTTNYDVLLEGAFRLAGFLPLTTTSDGFADRVPPTTLSHFSRVAHATQFFESGGAQRSATILKIHGCADVYRDAAARSPEQWRRYLPSMVFTYREVQNWRRDSWSRDLVRTTLRTRTLVLAGYSGQDPVLHDTFRSVYEEMAAQRSRSGIDTGGTGTKLDPESPAFFLDLAGKREFHGLEILRAASEAVGAGHAPAGDHRNLLSFHLVGEGFPDLDELMLWLFHRCFRRQQEKSLESELQRAVTRSVGRRPRSELSRLRQNFQALLRAERDAVGELEKGEAATRFAQIVRWTYHFHTALLREYAAAELVQRHQGPGLELSELRQPMWYYPASDRPDWTAWSVVLELALRRGLAAYRGKPESWVSNDHSCEPGEGLHPTLLYTLDDGDWTQSALCLFYKGYHPTSYTPSVRGAAHPARIWRLGEEDVPWSGGDSRDEMVSARLLWDLAVGDMDELKPRALIDALRRPEDARDKGATPKQGRPSGANRESPPRSARTKAPRGRVAQ